MFRNCFAKARKFDIWGVNCELSIVTLKISEPFKVSFRGRRILILKLQHSEKSSWDIMFEMDVILC
jgi:hypothetical protein